MEEDTAKSDHEKGSYTLIDFNRAGVPLMELVTEPITYNSKEEAAKASANFGKEYQRLLRTLGVSDADMEKGQMRLEANISITLDPKVFGTKCEVKNLNSFNSVEKAIMYEVDRHADMLAKGETILQETRGWNEQKLETFAQRKKENANDYRYFPDPDLPKMYLHEIFDIEKMRSELPILPNVKKEKYLSIGLSEKQIDQLLDDTILGKYYTSGIILLSNDEECKIFANYLLTDATGILSKDTALSLPKVKNFVDIIKMLSAEKLSSRGAKDLLLDIITKDVEEDKLELRAKELNLIQTVDPEAVKKVVEKVIAENQKEWAEYKAGAVKLEMFFVGKCMKESAGSGNPKAIIEILKSL
jgi:aspartyl-tRNA(Asn)/glutamyl-tRNA(Gln) amidotransferase subunit B